MTAPLTHTLGFPRLGDHRELKRATEAHWQGRLPREELDAVAREIRRVNWTRQRAAGIDLVPCNDFSFYDHVLDVTCLVGNVPARFGDAADPDAAFRVARGVSGSTCGCGGAAASEMTKWFDTNYHYIVPEIRPDQGFRHAGTKVFDEFIEARDLGFRAKPVLVGPVTYLLLGKAEGLDALARLDELVEVYAAVLTRLGAEGAEWVQLDEPALALDLTEAQRAAFARAYARLAEVGGPQLLVATYFGPLRENLSTFLALPVAALHYDAVRGGDEFRTLVASVPADKILSAGVIDGRNVWRANLDAALDQLEGARAALGAERLWVAPSCSLLHVPVSLSPETALDPELRGWLAFAEEKLAEVVTLRNALAGRDESAAFEANRAARAARAASARIHDPAVQRRVAAVRPADERRASPFAERQACQREKLRLPPYPTTTIGSFPQTAEVRAARAKWRRGELPTVAYEAYLRHLVTDCVAFQDAIGIDMPVHGEFERTDMVESFGEQLAGFAFTAHGWVQSYGTRCVKPPLIFGDVSRPRPMTVEWARFAQSLTTRPMKGMLTGPVTILQWSFVRDDQSRDVTARQIALAIRDEVVDLEQAGLAAIQIDEPAFREGLPLRRADWPAYLDWAARAFRLSASGVRDDTQIHTHMCYAEFNDIIEAIAALDADVITIETSRSHMELLTAFERFAYPNEIGPGVWDIHSPRVPDVDEMVQLLERARAVLPPDNLWVNPDCGLKTRGWPEVRAALTNLVAAARVLRKREEARHVHP